jgi:hypothetical protein
VTVSVNLASSAQLRIVSRSQIIRSSTDPVMRSKPRSCVVGVAGGDGSRTPEVRDDASGGGTARHRAPMPGAVEDAMQGLVTWPAHREEIGIGFVAELVVAGVVQVVGQCPRPLAHHACRVRVGVGGPPLA